MKNNNKKGDIEMNKIMKEEELIFIVSPEVFERFQKGEMTKKRVA